MGVVMVVGGECGWSLRIVLQGDVHDATVFVCCVSVELFLNLEGLEITSGYKLIPVRFSYLTD